MKAYLFKSVLLLLGGALYINVSFAQVRIAPIDKSSTERCNDEQFVLRVTDSVSRIRVAKMSSNDPMPGSKPAKVNTIAAVQSNDAPGKSKTFILRGLQVPDKIILDTPLQNLGDMKKD